MITITNTNSITITIAVTIAIVTISIIPRPNAHTYSHNRWEVGTRFHWKIGVGDLHSATSYGLPFLRNRRLQLPTPWPWGILRPWYEGHAEDQVETMISTNVMISATICHPPAAHRCRAPATQEVSESSTPDHTWKHIVKWNWECTWEHAWECDWYHLESLLGAYSQAGCVCAIECNWERPWDHAWECTEIVLGGVLWSILGVSFRVSWEVSRKRIVKQAGSV